MAKLGKAIGKESEQGRKITRGEGTVKHPEKGTMCALYEGQLKEPYVFDGTNYYPLLEEVIEEEKTTTNETALEVNAEVVNYPMYERKTQEIATAEDMIVDITNAKAEWDNYIELTKAILDESDYQEYKSRSGTPVKRKKKSAWRKYARFFGFTTQIKSEELRRDEKGHIVFAKYVVIASSRKGRTEEGIGACSISEGKNREHDIVATAHTRAKNRAISDLIGCGEVSAEEMNPLED